MDEYTFVLPVKNTVLLSEGCLSAGEESKFVGSAVTSCEVNFDQGIQGGQKSEALQLQGGKYSNAQVSKMRKALIKARSMGYKDYSSEMRTMIFKALH